MQRERRYIAEKQQCKLLLIAHMRCVTQIDFVKYSAFHEKSADKLFIALELCHCKAKVDNHSSNLCEQEVSVIALQKTAVNNFYKMLHNA